MQIHIARNFGPLVDVLKFTADDWGRVGRLARETIVRRTQAWLRDAGLSDLPPDVAGMTLYAATVFGETLLSRK